MKLRWVSCGWFAVVTPYALWKAWHDPQDLIFVTAAILSVLALVISVVDVAKQLRSSRKLAVTPTPGKAN